MPVLHELALRPRAHRGHRSTTRWWSSTHPTGLAPRERVAVEYTRAAMTDSNHIPESLEPQLKELFSDPELVELSFLIGFINMLNLFNNLLDVRYSGEYALLASA